MKQDKKKKNENPYVPIVSKILQNKRECSNSFTLRTDFKMQHEPGQFIQMTIPGIGEAPISICSYDFEKSDFHIREVGNVTNALSKLKKGDQVYIRGPYGKGYPMKEFEGKDLVIIGGGSGVAPLRGIISYLEKHREKYGKVALYFGFRSRDDIIFKDQIKQWEKKYDVHITVDKNKGKSNIHCDVCFITDVVDKAKLHPDNTIAFVCGPPVMMDLTIQILRNKGFSDDYIYVSTERLMQCALGLCGHCMIHGYYTCLDGPVFKYSDLSQHKNVEKIAHHHENI